jgi:hypothetical protein
MVTMKGDAYTRWTNSFGGVYRDHYNYTRQLVGPVDDGSQYTEHLLTSIPTNPDSHVNQAINKANPGSSDVDLGEFIGELRQLKDIRIPKKLRAVPIWYLFGVVPFMNDIDSLLNLTDSIDARMKLLNSLTGGTRSRNFGLGRDESRTYRTEQHCGKEVREERITRVSAWANVKDTIRYDRLKPPPKYDTSYVRKLLLSETPALTAWNLMPWSWLIDYFVDVDGMIRAFSNKVPGYELSVLNVCVEQQTRSNYRVMGDWPGWLSTATLNNGHWERYNFRRKVYHKPSPQPPTVWPILSNRQIGNIAALALALSANTKGYR